MNALADFQDAFAAALRDPDDADPRLQSIVRQPGFAVYRNTVVKGCIDAVQANFPTVTALVGEEWLRAAAAVYVRDALPTAPMLAVYGERFPAFLAGFAPARELPYLADVARCDRFWTEAHTARDEPAMSGAALAALSHEQLGAARLRPHAAARWAWFPAAPVAAIWLASRAGDALEHLPWEPDGLLVTRPQDVVRGTPLSHAGCAFLDACEAGNRISRALEAALGVDPDTDFAALMAQLVAAGAFTTLDTEMPS